MVLLWALIELELQGLHEIIPFNTARAVHTNLLVVWLLTGFMGAAYYIIPEEAQRELIKCKMGLCSVNFLAVVGVVAIVGFHFNHWEGRKFLEIPRELDFLVVVNVLLVLRINFRNFIQRKTPNHNSISTYQWDCCLQPYYIYLE